uniref:Dehydrogenase (Flavoprotein) n=1 Tax=Candidatus Kentrum sp. FW TaxID=2126338 RepID=A0A450SLC7_9GAMM|nr:MAG: Dehydrogenase (flavoprotein) [Candidatus Kentron sp. FW]
MKTDVVIIGAGPAGTAASLYLSELGIRSTIVEKDPFPRFHIGESLTGECKNVLNKLGLGKEMENSTHPVKHGVQVYGPAGKSAFWVPVKSYHPTTGQLQKTSTYQVRRSDFDKMLLDHAIAKGAAFVEGQAIEPLLANGAGVQGARIKTSSGSVHDFRSEVLIDATGPASFLRGAELTAPKERGRYTNQVAVFSQVTGAIRGGEGGKGEGSEHPDNTLILYQQKNHWAWFIPIDGEVVSIGVVVPSAYFASKKESKHDFLVREMRELNPKFAANLADATIVDEVRAVSNYSYHIKDFTGKGYLCAGDSHRFIDPIFSFGVHFSFSEGRMAAEAIKRYLNGENRDAANPFADYQIVCERGQDVAQSLIDTFWSHPLAFGYFVHVRYVDDCINMFSGRVYEEEASPGLIAMRELNAGAPEKEQQPPG